MSSSSSFSSLPHHRREDAELTNPAHIDGSSVTTGGPVVAMKVTDLDALSPRSAAEPPNFLDYAQKGAQGIQSQIPKKEYSAEDTSKEKSFSEKVNENWDLAKEKLSDAWNSTAAGSATKSQERVHQMVGQPDYQQQQQQQTNLPTSSYSSSSSSSSSSSAMDTLKQTGNSIAASVNEGIQSISSQFQKSGSSSNSDSSNINQSTSSMAGTGITHNNMSLSSNSSDAASTHSVTSTTMGEDGKEHSIQSSYSVRQMPLSDGKVEVREEWADRQDNGPVNVKKETTVVDSDDAMVTK